MKLEEAAIAVWVVLFMIVSAPAEAECIDPTQCFCSLVPEQCEMLVTAEVMAFEEMIASLQVVGEPHHDPEGILQDGQLIEGLKYSRIELAPGNVGLFRIHPPGACVIYEPNDFYIASFVLESSGKYFCETRSEFSGARKDQLLAAILSGTCYESVLELMDIKNYCEGESGCCYQTMASVDSVMILAVLGLVLVPRGNRRSRGRTKKDNPQ
jgi:hypothetical protein